MKQFPFLFWALLLTARAEYVLSVCKVEFEAIGCYTDTSVSPRPLPDFILNERSKIDWTNWNDYLEGLACRCAEMTLKKGYETFGLQSYGECWSGPEYKVDLDRDGPAENCVTRDYKPCKPSHTLCTGGGYSNFIYKLRPPTCSIKFERVGCYHDFQKKPRPLPHYILTDRDRQHAHYNGTDIDWKNWNTYMPSFVCRCAQFAKSRGYRIFGVQFFGECWSGPADTYMRDGESSQCVSKDFRPCAPDDKYCAGKQYTNFVYRFVEECDVDYVQLGCFRDNLKKPRPLPRLLLNERDVHSKVWNGHVIQWHNWDEYIEKLICRCAKRTFTEKYNIFGLQFYGECWSGEDGEKTYNRDGNSNQCITKGFKDCPGKGKHCVGHAVNNYVYTVTSCDVKFKALGCFHDNLAKPRPLPDLILTERDPTSTVYNGRRIGWKHWDQYLPQFVCRCARRAKELKHKVFGVQFYGECWSGKDAVNSYGRDGNSSSCIDKAYQPCKPNDNLCIGQGSTNFVYQIRQI